ncbi:MAG: hypothetical protein J3K34DRAFT_516252 [Monoraphidium minutum]|nr:MAG: hypothetical protein J3K34DRAFT_516252 [Monoraphidium minutum]
MEVRTFKGGYANLMQDAGFRPRAAPPLAEAKVRRLLAELEAEADAVEAAGGRPWHVEALLRRDAALISLLWESHRRPAERSAMATAGTEDPADAELKENRFAYLLQPIRDLASNWDIDIAAELEEYLEELEGITFAIEDCGPSLNFAEAALLIQGTTCVYSKKVEYLHNLVFRALETIHNKKQRERAIAEAEEGGGKRGGRLASGDDLDDAFLCLDEVAQGQVAGEGDIDLEEDDDDSGAPELLRPPTALLALEDAAAGQGETDAGSYRLAQCSVHESGALLLELRDGEAYDRQLRSRGWQPGGMAAAVAAAAAAAAAGGAAPAGEFGGFGAGEEGYDDDGGGDDWGGCDDGGSDDGGAIDLDDGLVAAFAGGQGALGEAGAAGEGAAGEDQFDDGLGAEQGAGAAAEEGAAAALRQRRAGAEGAGGRVVAAKEVFDPYRPLDPNDKGALLIKPLQVRKPRNRALRAAAGTEGPATAPGAAPGQLAFAGEFGYLADALAQARRALASNAARQRRGARARPAGAGVVGLLPHLQGRAVLDWSDVAQAEREEAAALTMGAADAAMGHEGDDDWGGGDDGGWGGGGDDSDGELAPPGEGPGALQAALEEAAMGPGGWLSGGEGGGGGGGGGDESRLSYEELCRAHIEKLIAAAAAQQTQSDLQVRVATWRQRIDPVLSAEEDRSAFDIHDYGGAILTRLGGEEQAASEEEAKPFRQVVACDNPFEVARMFAAMLQLVNNRNVELCRSDVENPSQPFGLQLLSTNRHHEAMGEAIGATAGPASTQLAAATVLAAATAHAAGATCDAAAAALAPAGGLKGGWVGSLSPQMLFFQALADFSYSEDFLVSTQRRSVGPCLTAWGAKDWKRIDAKNKLGADVHALLVRTDADIIVVFRGMDSRRDARFMDSVTSPVYDAAYFGAAATAAAAAEKKLPDGKPNPEAFFTLEGYTLSYEAIRPAINGVIKEWEAKSPVPPSLWYSGHSDGSQLAQLAALKAADEVGADRIGGVVLFGPSRVGSRGFASFFNSLLGARTVYYAYGRDPASTTDYTLADGLMFPGVGLRACPFQGESIERLVVVPLGKDREDVCSELKASSSFLSRLVLPDWVLDTSDPAMDHLSSYEFLPHHIPAITYDGLMRMLLAGQGAAKPSVCQLAALREPDCFVSSKCSAALRPAGAKFCRGCASDKTCTSYWGMAGGRCDRAWSELSGWMCYESVPGTQINLYLNTNGAPKVMSLPSLDLDNSMLADLGRKGAPATASDAHRADKL